MRYGLGLYFRLIGVFRRVKKLQKATIGFDTSVRPPGKTRHPLDGFFMVFDTTVFFEKNCRKILVSLKHDKNSGTLHEDLRACVIKPR